LATRQETYCRQKAPPLFVSENSIWHWVYEEVIAGTRTGHTCTDSLAELTRTHIACAIHSRGAPRSDITSYPQCLHFNHHTHRQQTTWPSSTDLTLHLPTRYGAYATLLSLYQIKRLDFKRKKGLSRKIVEIFCLGSSARYSILDTRRESRIEYRQGLF